MYTPLLGPASELTGASLQNHWDAAHQRRAEVAARVGARRAGRGSWRTTSRATPRWACRPTRATRASRPREGEEPARRVRPPRHPPADAVGHADGGRRGRRVLLRLLAAAERPAVRGLALARALVGLRRDRAALLRRAEDPGPGDGAAPTRSSATRPRTTAGTRSRRRASSTSSTCPAGGAAELDLGAGERALHRRVVRSPPRRRAAEGHAGHDRGRREASPGPAAGRPGRGLAGRRAPHAVVAPTSASRTNAGLASSHSGPVVVLGSN